MFRRVAARALWLATAAAIAAFGAPGFAQSSPDITGLWIDFDIIGFGDAVPKRMIEVSGDASEELQMTVIALDTTTQAWAGLRDIEYQDGVLHCVIPGWSMSRRTFDGTMQPDGNTVLEASYDETKRRWERVEDADTVEWFQGLVSCIGESPAEYVYRPPEERDDGLEVAHMADVGFDVERISDLVERILAGAYYDVHDILIFKDGKLVLEEYFRFDGRMYGEAVEAEYRDRIHMLASQTKTVTGILVGLAIDAGFIESAEAPVYGFFPQCEMDDERKAGILLRHFLTMTAGLEWDPNMDNYRMITGESIIEIVLDRPIASEPGEAFVYSNGISTVLGRIVAEASQMEVAEFAEEYLFGPLGITDFDLRRYPDGTTNTDGSLALRPRDLVKIGLMILDDGRYGDHQIVSTEWIEESTQRHVSMGGGEWYGYQLGHADFNVGGRTISSLQHPGSGGQVVFIVPELDMIVVTHGANFGGYKDTLPYTMLRSYILPALLQH